MRETDAAVSGMSAAKAVRYLKDVEEHKQCVPFRRRTFQCMKTIKPLLNLWAAQTTAVLDELLRPRHSRLLKVCLSQQELVHLDVY